MKTCPVCDMDYPDQHFTCPSDGAVLIEARELGPGSLVRAKYRIERKLGQGGMGVVYLAEDIMLSVRVALKFLAGELGKDPRFIKRFKMEARAAYRLRHTNIVAVISLDQDDDGTLFIAMEYVDGPGLRTLLDHACEGLPIPDVLEIARGIASGLAEAHAHGFVHRDIKPENILLENGAHGTDRPKILDFGLVAVAESIAGVSLTRGLLLTPAYAAPEQWLEMPSTELDGRTDLYALGCVLYEMLTGQKPFQAQNSVGWMKQHLEVVPRPPSELRPVIAEWNGLDALVLSLLAKDRAHRPANARELLIGLSDLSIIDTEPAVSQLPFRVETEWEQPVAPFVTIREGVVEPTSLAHLRPDQEADQQLGQPTPDLMPQTLPNHPESVFALERDTELRQGSGEATPRVGLPQGSNDGLDSSRVADKWLRKISNQRWVRVATILCALAVAALLILHGIAPVLFYEASIRDKPWAVDASGFLYGALGPNRTSGRETQRAHACAMGDADACLALGEFFRQIESKPSWSSHFFNRAEDLFNERCFHGDGGGCYALGVIYPGWKEATISSTMPPALWFERSCTAGAKIGCMKMADAYREGDGVKRDLARAEDLYDKSCALGPPEQCPWEIFDSLGDNYNRGDVVPRDLDRAAALYRKACGGGGSPGCSDLFEIATDFDLGKGVKTDHVKAATLYASACNGGEFGACFYLGVDYDTGEGVHRDPAKAAGLYKRACDGEDYGACSNLGNSYTFGKGVKMNTVTGVALYRRACQGGDQQGCGNLGSSYFMGRGIPLDKAKGIALVKGACRAGNLWSCQWLKWNKVPGVK